MEDDPIIVFGFQVFPGVIHCGKTASRREWVMVVIPKDAFLLSVMRKGPSNNPSLLSHRCLFSFLETNCRRQPRMHKILLFSFLS